MAEPILVEILGVEDEVSSVISKDCLPERILSPPLDLTGTAATAYRAPDAVSITRSFNG
jgi:hypothetical protein